MQFDASFIVGLEALLIFGGSMALGGYAIWKNKRALKKERESDGNSERANRD